MARRSLRDPLSRRSILERLARLEPTSPRRWGSMEPEQLLPHLAYGLQVALGERAPSGTPPHRLRGTLMRVFAIHWLPWPEGKIPAPPGAFTNLPTSWAADRATLADLIERFAETPPEALGPAHSSFGAMTPRDWDVLQYRHLDHHLRQFGA